MKKILLVDLTKCTGCEMCVDACSDKRLGFYSEKGSLVRLHRNDEHTLFIPLLCECCAHHPCVDVCPVSAFKYDTEAGVFVIDENECTGCGECEEACPFEGIFMTDGTAQKCDLCKGDPLCSKFCIPGAIQWAELNRTTLLSDLHNKIRKIEELKSESLS